MPVPARLVSLPDEYFEAIKTGTPAFSTLFQFENALRSLINKFFVDLYGEDWWERSLKVKLPKVYEYVEDQKKKSSYMPWIGDSGGVELTPLHSTTLGQLEQIVTKYQFECIPLLFPTLEFFTGHMLVIKKVRNLFSHMYPCINKSDIATLKREVKTLIDHIEAKRKVNKL